MSVDGLVVDLFAGGGGASTGLAWALGRDPDIAINHDAEALALHAANHPHTQHLQNDITRILPLEATVGREVAILHASPDCTHFSKAKGGKPRSQHIRDLAWVVIRWAEDTHPVLITLENVEEFQTWGPLDQDGHPIKAQAGQTFRAWTRRLRRLGYQVAWRLLRACDYGAPTTRKRLFVVARRDRGRIAWPRPTHGAPESPEVQSGKLLPWRTAAECIDWHLQSRSIFDRAKPLARNTQRRIAEGLRRYVFQAAEPFVISYYGAKAEGDFRGQTLHRPLPTQTTENRFGLVSPVVITNTSGHAPKPVDAPLPTVTTGKQQLVAGAIISPNHVASEYTPFRGQDIREPLRTITRAPGFALASLRTVPFVQHVQHGSAKHGVMPADEPMRTITAWPKGGGMALVGATLERAEESVAAYAPFIAKNYGGVVGHDVARPLGTVTTIDHHSLATACMVKYYGNEQGGVPVSAPLHTITSKDRMGLITATLEGVDERAARTRDWLREWGVIGPTDEPIIGHGAETYRITDIYMRMLAPRELYNAQGFPPDYKIDTPYKGKPMSKTAQVRMCGNSVPPVLVYHLVKSNGPETWRPQVKPSKPLINLSQHVLEAAHVR
ncbi:DNA cytosine methyltransferase [Desulfovibrio sp.]|uniref:DNA cytosine methyltransferase n=1 Tax=Desulfovibrio sp. TaxID=885 RepID=UPI0023BCA00C|nr:DNA cytosine methyltransferase [Desulfovibrio sp.]MDE7242048.1 DNA cytosine methyltransferase [Desulfovibrio sp.]